ncbi:tail length tape measure protein [Bacillus phage PBC2]|uniref:Putative tail tape measure protein n=1 Tax=Bacillus phage PBC2 TaxID=1675029 RepID=A0A218KCA6_9CAUD|nr:tail length tape measure protein [Bacillus phage PBC2]AKQ08523.1 putative tail tape measure protein [Bacillus phage PBC2]
MAGNNDLNMILKAQVVKLKVELDAKGSKLPAQVNAISKMLANNPVKLKVKLEAKASELKAQLGAINTLVNGGKFKPIKLGVELDLKGTATKMNKQMKEMYDSFNAMNKKYAEQSKKAQEQVNKATAKQQQAQGNVKVSAPVGNFNNIKQYLKQMEEAERILRSKFKDGGTFKTTQFKDAEGNLRSFVGELQRANGVIEKVRYNWNAQSGKFQLVDRQTISDTQKSLAQAEASLKRVKDAINSLKNTDGKIALLSQFDNLKNMGGDLTKNMVKGLQDAVKAEQALQRETAQTNKLKAQQAKILSDIGKARAKDVNNPQLKGFENMAKNGVGADGKTVSDLSAHYKQLARDVQAYTDSVKRSQAELKTNNEITKQQMQLQRELRKLQAQAPKENANGQLKLKFINETIAMNEQIKKLGDVQKQYEALARVRDRIGQAKSDAWMDTERAKAERLMKSLESVKRQMETRGMNISGVTEFQNYAKNVNASATEIERALAKYQRMLNDKKEQIRATERNLRLGENITDKYGGKDKVKQMNEQLFKSGGVDAQTIANLQRYISAVEGAKVASISFGRDGVDAMGNKVKNMSVTMAGTGEHVRRLGLSFTQGANVIRQSSDEMVRNVNRNLSAFEKLKGMMSSAPMWMLSQAMMTAPIQGLQAMTREILEVDKAMTNIRRVADASLNTDIMFGNAVGLSKELGNNIHDILSGMEEFSRTFGDFNERQLTAITKTATLMSNVSDLKVQDAQASLVGTMNAFNISAEDSVSIVDKLNQVDNDYAISTQQLATGLQKSASTAKTYGVTLEENIGHTTAIGAVTMESGQQIGNALKTIYSRVTGLKASESTLKAVGVEMYEMGENGKELRDVGDILNDLGGKWGSLTNQQQQNTAVTLAGRNHLTKFLALMNNYDTAIKATVTAWQSQGSAMRENEKYLQSMEAKINQTKNSFTTMSVAFGKAFVSDGIVAVAQGLGVVLNLITQIASNHGGLALVFGTIGMIMTQMGKFSGIQGAVTGFFSKFTEGFRGVQRESNSTVVAMDRFRNGAQNAGNGLRVVQQQGQQTATVMERIRGGFTNATGGMSGMATAFRTAGTAVLGFGKAFTMSLLSMGAFGVAIGAIGWAIEKVVGHFQKLKAEQEAVERATNKMVDGYRKNINTVDGLIQKYETMNQAFKNGTIEIGTKQYDEFLIVQSQLADILPTTVERIDANGQAWLKNSDEVRKALEMSKQLSEAKAKEMDNMRSENIEKQTKAIQKMVEEEEKLAQKRKEAEEYRKKATWYESRDEREANYKKMILDLGVKERQLNIEKAEGYQKINAELTKYARAGLEASGAMQKLGDGAQKAVDNFMKVNTDKLAKDIKSGAVEGAEAISKAMDNIVKGGVGVGEIFAKEFDRMSQGIDTSTNKGKTKVEELKKAISQVGQAIPERFMSLENFNGDIDKMQSKLKEFIELGVKIQKDGGQGFDGYVKSAEKLGLKTEEAKGFVMNLGKASENAELRAKSAAEAQNGYADAVGNSADGTNASADALAKQADAQSKANAQTIEAIDLQEKLYGYKNEEVSAIKGHLEGLKMSKMLYGENAKNTQQYGQSVTELSNRLGVSRGEIEQNIDKYILIADAVGQFKTKIDESGNVVEDFGNMTEKQKGLFNEWRKSMQESGQATDVFTGKLDEGKYKYDEFGNRVVDNANKVDQAGDKVNQAGDKAKEGGDKVNQAGDSVQQGTEKVANSETNLQAFMETLGKLGEKSGQTGQQVLEGLQKINIADFSQIQAKSSELGISMDKVVEYAKIAGSITPEEMAKIGNSSQFLQMLDDKMKGLSFNEATQKSGETATKIESDMQRVGNAGAPLSLLETKMKNLGFDEAQAKSGETASTISNNMSIVGNSGGSLGVLTGKLDEAKGKMDETKTNVETNVSGINTSMSTLGQGFDTNNRWKTGAQLFNEAVQGMSKQAGTSAQEIQGHVTTIGNAGNALDQYKIAVDNVKGSLSGLAQEVTGTATGLSQFGMAFAGAGQAMSGFQQSMSAVRGEMSNVISQAGGTASSLESVGTAMGNAGASASSFTVAMGGVSISASLASQSMALMGMAGATASSGLAQASQASQASAQASNNNAQAKNNEANASQNSATASFNVANAKNTEAQAIMSAINATQSMAMAYSTMASAGSSAISSLISAIMSYLQAVMTMASMTASATSAIRSAFMGMSGAVTSSTGAMISAHNSQASALNKVKDSANQAKSAVQGLNSTISGAMSNLSSYIAKANEASNVRVAPPSLPPLPTGASWNMSTINNIAGNGEVAGAVGEMSSYQALSVLLVQVLVNLA